MTKISKLIGIYSAHKNKLIGHTYTYKIRYCIKLFESIYDETMSYKYVINNYTIYFDDDPPKYEPPKRGRPFSKKNADKSESSEQINL